MTSYQGTHEKPRTTDSCRLPRAAVAAMAAAAAAPAVLAVAGAAPAAASSLPKRLEAFDAARTRAGDPYVYGDAGPSAFDCSGLVQWAYRQAGISLPRDTFEMLAAVASGLLIPESTPRKGDLAFFGTGHVELFVRPGHTFGAQQSGTPVWWHPYSGWWHPTMWFRVRGAG